MIEKYSFHDDNFNWSEEMLALVIFLTMLGNVWSAGAGPKTDSLIGSLFILMAVGLLVYLVFAAIGNIPITPSLFIFLGLMMVSAAANGFNLFGCAATQRALGKE